MIRGGRREKHKIVQIAVFPIIFVLIVDAAFKRLKNYTIKIFESFYKNQFKSNVDKYKFITTRSQKKFKLIGFVNT